MVKKKNKTVLFLILGILLIGAIGAGIYFTTSTTQSGIGLSGCSGQVLSINNAQVTLSDSPSLGKKVVRVVYSTLPQSECLNIRFSADEIENKLKSAGYSEFDVTKSVIGNVELIKSQKIYGITDKQNMIRKLSDSGEISYSGFNTCSVKTCGEKGYSTSVFAIKNSKVPYYGCHCIYTNDLGTEGEFKSSEGYDWETKVDVGGLQTTLNRNNLNDVLGSKVYIQWAGNLQSNDNLGSINRAVFKPLSTNNWRILNKDFSQKIEDELTRTKDYVAQECYDLDVWSPISIANAITNYCPLGITRVNQFNAFADTQINANNPEAGRTSWISTEPMVENAVISSNKMTVDLSSPIVYPTFVFEIDAESVGIFRTSGQPEVTCPSNIPTFVSGREATSKISITNKGDYKSSFIYSISCNKGSQTLLPAAPLSVDGKSTREITATLGLTVVEGTDTSFCTFEAKSSSDLSLKDSCTFSYSATHQSQCIEGAKTCESGNAELWTCLEDGSYKKDQCKFGCEAFENTYRCRLQAKEICDDGIDNDGNGLVDLDDPQCKNPVCEAWIEIGGKTIIPDLFCIINNFITNLIVAFSVILGLIGGAIAGSFAYGFTKEKSNKVKLISVGLSFVILASVVAVLSLLFFWWILLALVILGIIKAFIPGI